MTITFRQGPFSIGFLEETVGQCRYLRFFPGEKDVASLKMMFHLPCATLDEQNGLLSQFRKKVAKLKDLSDARLRCPMSDVIIHPVIYVSVCNGAAWAGLTEDQMREATKVEAALLQIGKELGLTPDVDPDAEKLAWIPEWLC